MVEAAILEGAVNADVYLIVLKEQFLPFVQVWVLISRKLECSSTRMDNPVAICMFNGDKS